MTTLRLSLDADAELYPFALSWEPEAHLVGDSKDPAYTIYWTHTYSECQCLIIIAPENGVWIGPLPQKFRPVGPWTYQGRYDYSGHSSALDYWEGEDHHKLWAHFPDARYAAADRHTSVCREFRAERELCANCRYTRHYHYPTDQRPRGLTACETFRGSRQRSSILM